MYRTLVVVTLPLSLLCIGSVHNLKTPRIVGGSPGYFPYAVSIVHKQGFFVCGGTLISNTVVATTARCTRLFHAGELLVRSGSLYKDRGGTVTPVLSAFRHEKFTDHSPDYDVGVLLLQGGVDEQTEAVKLAKKEVSDGEVLIVSGWGSTEENGTLSDKLRTVGLSKMERGECQRFYDGEYEITPRMICGSSPRKGLCRGDVGGPAVWKGRLVGIISFGMGCGKPDRPGVFTNVAWREIRKFLEDYLELRGSTERAIGIEAKEIWNV